MVEHYRKIQKFLPTSDLDIMPLLVNDEEKQELEVLYQNLDEINRVTNVFQAETGMSLAKLRYILDGLIRVFSSMEQYLSKAAIVQSPDFENAIMKCIEGKFFEPDIWDKSISSKFGTSGARKTNAEKSKTRFC